jgi:hypothetical protein
MSPSVADKPVVAQRQDSVNVQNNKVPLEQSRPNQATVTGQEKMLDANTPRRTSTVTDHRRSLVTPGSGNTTDTSQKSVKTSTHENTTDRCTRSGRIIRKPSYLQDFVQK